MIETLAGCRIVEEVASGGMAVVYRAVQDSLNRTVAIKALRTHAAEHEPSVVSRFEREAKALANLQHQNIIHVYDYGCERGAHFMIMEYVRGIDIYDLLDRCGAVPYDVGAIIGLSIARALDYVHYRGILHRDIKPANIMISRQGGIKVMDFGIARDENQQDLTEVGVGIGTPAYMSPEQILGDKLDARSDIFSLGVVLYQVVTGEKPFVEDDNHSVMQKIRLHPHVPARKRNPEVPRELDKIIDKCLQKHPKDRYRSAQALAMALERFLARHVSINYHARLVLFLRNQKIITEFEADQYIGPALANPGETGIGAPNSIAARTAVLAFARTQGLAMAIMFGVLFLLHVAPFDDANAEQNTDVATDTPLKQGYVSIVARPWAKVYHEDKLIAETPLASPIALPSGQVTLRFESGDYQPITRTVFIEPGNKKRPPKLLVDFQR